MKKIVLFKLFLYVVIIEVFPTVDILALDNGTCLKLAGSGRPIVFSICAWEFKNWMPATGNLWRTTGDINWTGGCNGQPCWGGVLSNMDGTANLRQYAKPGQWNDPVNSGKESIVQKVVLR